MKHSAIIPVLAALLFATACTKTIEFDGQQTQSLPVLISLPNSDSTLSLRLTYSRFFLDNSPVTPIKNASIRVELNGSNPSVSFSPKDNGVYLSNLVLHDNDTLTLFVSIPNKGEISAGCRMPFRPHISDLATDSIHIDSYSYPDDPYNPNDSTLHYWAEGNLHFHFTLHDAADQDNYYMICAYTINNNTQHKSYYELDIEDNILFDNTGSNEHIDLDIEDDPSMGSQIFFTDERINGHNHTIKGQIHYLYADLSQETPYIEVRALSRDTYLHLITKNKQSQSNDILGFISEPIQIHSNVHGGIGILGAQSAVVQPINLIK